jgi:hypothetical protein
MWEWDRCPQVNTLSTELSDETDASPMFYRGQRTEKQIGLSEGECFKFGGRDPVTSFEPADPGEFCGQWPVTVELLELRGIDRSMEWCAFQ